MRQQAGIIIFAASATYVMLSSAAVAASGAASDPEGMLAFNNHCRECHSYAAGDNRIGPSLAGVVGRKAGSATGFEYSQSLASANFSWTPELLDRWIANPESVVPGNNMASLFPGLPDASLRKKIVGFLKAVSSQTPGAAQ